MINNEPKRGGSAIPSKKKIYRRIAAHADEIIDHLLELTESKNENIKLGALKVLINKVIPDLKQVDGAIDANVKIVIDRELKLDADTQTLYSPSESKNNPSVKS